MSSIECAGNPLLRRYHRVLSYLWFEPPIVAAEISLGTLVIGSTLNRRSPSLLNNFILKIIFRLQIILSKIIEMKIITNINDVIDPIDEIKFQNMNSL